MDDDKIGFSGTEDKKYRGLSSIPDFEYTPPPPAPPEPASEPAKESPQPSKED